MSCWKILEGRQGWEAQRNGVRVVHAPTPAVWAYVARHASDAEPVTVRYASGRTGLVRNGAELRALLGTQTNAPRLITSGRFGAFPGA